MILSRRIPSFRKIGKNHQIFNFLIIYQNTHLSIKKKQSPFGMMGGMMGRSNRQVRDPFDAMFSDPFAGFGGFGGGMTTMR